MSRDSDLVVTCKCGQVSITKLDGYLNSDLVDAAHLGMLAEEGCRKKRLRRWLFALGIVVLAAFLVAGTGWWVGEKHKMDIVKAEEWSWKAEKLMKEEEYAKAVEAYTKAIEAHPTVRSYLSRAYAYDELGMYHASLEDCQLAIRLDPSHKGARRSAARVQERLIEKAFE